MEASLLNYIKNMFAMETTPTWDASYEGILFYDKNAKSWITGNNEGWQKLDRATTYPSSVPFPTQWVDPFEYPTDEAVNANYVSSTLKLIGVAARSIIFDIEDNWGDTSWIGIRELDFYLGDEKIINLPTINFEAYVTSEHSIDYQCGYAFDTSLSKIGLGSTRAWQTLATTNQRLICVFNTPTNFDKIRVSNYHSIGDLTTRGVKNAKIYYSTDAITSTVYGEAISNSILIFDSIFNQHVALNQVDEQELVLQNVTVSGALLAYSDSTNTTYGSYSMKVRATTEAVGESILKEVTPELDVTDKEVLTFDIRSSRVGGTNLQILLNNPQYTAKSIILDIADNWGDTNYVGIRQIDFWYLGSKITNLDITDFTDYVTSEFGSGTYGANQVFDTTTLKTGELVDTSWVSATANITEQRLICVFIHPIIFDEIRVNNSHASGVELNRGAKNVKINLSTDAITSTVYDEFINNSILLFDDMFDQHVALDVEDEQILTLTSLAITHDINIQGLDTFQTENWDITTYSGTYSQLGFKVLNDDLDNTFHIDNMRLTERETETITWIDSFEYPTDTILNNNYTSTSGVLYATARSIVFDCVGNWGESDYLALRSIEFYYEGNLIEFDIGDVTVYGTNFEAPGYAPENAFDQTTLKTGSYAGTGWLADSPTSQRLIIDFGEDIIFNEIVINNHHNTGTDITRGVQNIEIYYSPASISDTTYGATVTSGTLIFDSSLEQHTAVDEIDDQILELENLLSPLNIYSEDTINTFGSYSLKAVATMDYSQGKGFSKVFTPVINVDAIDSIKFDIRSSRVGETLQAQLHNNIIYTAKTVVFDILDDHGDTSYMSVRSIEFYLNGGLIPNIATTDFIATSSSQHVLYLPEYSFDTSTSKIGSFGVNAWISSSNASQRLICTFNTITTFDNIVINNGHDSGTNTDIGIKNIKISMTLDEVPVTTFSGELTNATTYFNGIIPEHITSNIIDDIDMSLLLDAPDATINKDINIQALDTFQTVTWDLTTVSGIYTNLGFKVSNDDLENTFYIDKMIKRIKKGLFMKYKTKTLEKILLDVVEHGHDIVWALDTNLIIIYLSEAIEKYGWERKELIGKNILDIMTEESQKVF